MIEIGKYNTLKILREMTPGLYLGDGEGEEEEVLLPSKYCPEEFEIDDMLEVFVYLDSEQRKISTTLTPKIVLYQFALLQVAAVTDVGAFLDMGIAKELLVPFSEQKTEMVEGRSYIIYMDLDTKTNRLYGTARVEKYLQNDEVLLEEKEEVKVLVQHRSDLGFTVIVNDEYKGLIFDNEIFKDPPAHKKSQVAKEEGEKNIIHLCKTGLRRNGEKICKITKQKRKDHFYRDYKNGAHDANRQMPLVFFCDGPEMFENSFHGCKLTDFRLRIPDVGRSSLWGSMRKR